MIPATLAVVVSAFPPRERGKALAIFFEISGGLTAIGPIAGSYLTQWTWRAIFWINIPVAILALVLTVMAGIHSAPRHERIDWWGAALIASGMALSTLGFEQAASWGWADLGSGVAFSAGWRSWWCSSWCSYARRCRSSRFEFSTTGRSLSTTRCCSVPWSRSLPSFSLGAIGFGLWAWKLTDLSLGAQWWAIVLAGAGIGLLLGPASTDAANRAIDASYGEVTGITQTVRNHGSALGLAVLGTVLGNVLASRLTDSFVSFGVPPEQAAGLVVAAAASSGQGGSTEMAVVPADMQAKIARRLRTTSPSLPRRC